MYFTNLSRSEYFAPDIAHLHWARAEVELLLKELKSWFRLNEIKMNKSYNIKALIIMAASSAN